MKKVICTFLLILTFLIVYFLQANFFSWFTIASVQPNLFILLILFVGLFAGIKMGTGYGILIGFLIDLLFGKNIGIATTMCGILGFLGGYFDKNFSKDSRFTIMFMVIGATFLYELGTYVFNIILYSNYAEPIYFARTLAIEIVYNTILTIILYPMIKWLGYRMEEIFKGQKILTRYF